MTDYFDASTIRPIDTPTPQIILYAVTDWPDSMTASQFNNRLLGLIIDLRQRLGLHYWPHFGKMPQGCTARGWYARKGKGWDLFLSDDVNVTALTLAGVNLWLEGSTLRVLLTPEAENWDRDHAKTARK